MADCSHGNSAPNSVIAGWPECQAGEGRHKCAVCAYAEGKAVAQGKTIPGPIELCDQGHDSAPLNMLKSLPSSQAGPHRHRCAYRAYQDGKAAGAALVAQQDPEAADDTEQKKIESRTDIGPTAKEQLILARRGQGIFRQNVLTLNPACAFTQISDNRFLVASHIKPWRASDDNERLDGYNGLMLTPHADRLFDKGWVTFKMNGEVVKSPQLPDAIWTAFGFGAFAKTNPFKPQAAPYLEYHQDITFQK